jgi:hypothetical protein
VEEVWTYNHVRWNKSAISYQLIDCAMKFVTKDYNNNNNEGSKAVCRLYAENAYVDMIRRFSRVCFISYIAQMPEIVLC